jgi:hypothetical protein
VETPTRRTSTYGREKGVKLDKKTGMNIYKN